MSGVIRGEAMMGVKGTNGRRLDVVARGARKVVPTACVLLTNRDDWAASKLCEDTATGIIGGATWGSGLNSFCAEERRSSSEGALREELEYGEGGGTIDVCVRTSIIVAIRSQCSARWDVAGATRFMGSIRGVCEKKARSCCARWAKLTRGIGRRGSR